MSKLSERKVLRVENFAQIRRAEVDFGDLTVLVGPQGSGKSLLLQLFKLALDQDEITRALTDAGHTVTARSDFLDVYLGHGMGKAWSGETRVLLNGRQVSPTAKRRQGSAVGNLFYIPAHRALLLAEGWPAPFLKLTADTPVIARLFSQNLFSLFADPRNPELFPVPRHLKDEYRRVIDEAVYHGGRVQLEREGLRKRLELQYGEMRLPFMTWTAGQREFTPLLLGLYHLLPPRKLRKREEIDWVVIEEPEMGLHPRATAVVMLLVLDLLWRGYRVVISTHAPLVLDVMFTLRSLAERKASPKTLCEAFEVPHSQQLQKVMTSALQKTFRTYYMKFVDGAHVESTDISSLSPFAEDPDVADWGGLTQLSTSFGHAIAGTENAQRSSPGEAGACCSNTARIRSLSSIAQRTSRH